MAADIIKLSDTLVNQYLAGARQTPFELTNDYQDDGTIDLASGRVEEIGGSYYRVEGGSLSITDGIGNGLNAYVHIKDDGDGTASAYLSIIAGLWDEDKGGYYHTDGAKVVFQLEKVTSSNYLHKTRRELNSSRLEQALRSLIFPNTISSQADFDAALERVAPNQYKFKDKFNALTFKYLSSGYQMSSAISGGDTWGYIETNNCANIKFEPEAFIDFENERGYIEVDTDDCILDSADLRGTGTVASAITQSFYLNAYRVSFRNCKSSNRLSNTTFNVFYGDFATPKKMYSSSFNNCIVRDIECTNSLLYGFNQLRNINNCIVYDCSTTGAIGVLRGFADCLSISLCTTRDCTSESDLFGFFDCQSVSSCRAIQLEATSASTTVAGFVSTNAFFPRNLSSCYAESIIGTELAYGFKSLANVSGCGTFNIIGGVTTAHFSTIYSISGCFAQQTVAGNAAVNMSMFTLCFGMAGCYAHDNSTVAIQFGFLGCESLAGCHSAGLSSGAYQNCTYGAALNENGAAYGTGNDFMDTVDLQVTNKVSCRNIFV